VTLNVPPSTLSTSPCLIRRELKYEIGRKSIWSTYIERPTLLPTGSLPIAHLVT